MTQRPCFEILRKPTNQTLSCDLYLKLSHRRIICCRRKVADYTVEGREFKSLTVCITSANLIIYNIDGGQTKEEVYVCVCWGEGWGGGGAENVLEIFCLALFFVE